MLYTKTNFKQLKQYAKENGVRFLAADCASFRHNARYNGIGIAYTLDIKDVDCRMLRVAASYCAGEDQFDYRKGQFHALNKLLVTGDSILLPLGQVYIREGIRAIENKLLSTLLV